MTRKTRRAWLFHLARASLMLGIALVLAGIVWAWLKLLGVMPWPLT